MGDDNAFVHGWASARATSSAKWAPAILVALQSEALHYTELLAAVRASHNECAACAHCGHLHEGILTRSLKTLTDDGLLSRTEAVRVFPPSVEYALTPAGRELLAAVRPLADWGRRHRRPAA